MEADAVEVTSSTEKDMRPVSRRHFLRRGGLVLAGLAGALAAGGTMAGSEAHSAKQTSAYAGGGKRA